MAIQREPYSTNCQVVKTTHDSVTGKDSTRSISIAPGSQKLTTSATDANLYAIAQLVSPLFAGSLSHVRRTEVYVLENG